MTEQYLSYNIIDKKNECTFVGLKVEHSVAYFCRTEYIPTTSRVFGLYLNAVCMAYSITYR